MASHSLNRYSIKQSTHKGFEQYWNVLDAELNGAIVVTGFTQQEAAGIAARMNDQWFERLALYVEELERRRSNAIN